ncbi:MAG: hypothetical protein OXJ37_16045 [Bryobacterales bacterium]|nr:hypothetical protein [Bryobacterales bacterium]MDE0620277.1 hypothetical protein [Bryobacterales bacterium]
MTNSADSGPKQLNMPGIAVGIGVSLLALGIGVYLASGRSSLTALIPAAFGIALVALGFIAKRPSATKHAMHAAAVISVLGFLGSVDGIVGLAQMVAGATVERPLAVAAKGVMAVDLATFLWLCVRSFRQARLARG